MGRVCEEAPPLVDLTPQDWVVGQQEGRVFAIIWRGQVDGCDWYEGRALPATKSPLG